jgi:aquaporin Z
VSHSPGGYAWWAVILAEVLLTAFFVYIILGVTDSPLEETTQA